MLTLPTLASRQVQFNQRSTHFPSTVTSAIFKFWAHPSIWSFTCPSKSAPYFNILLWHGAVFAAGIFVGSSTTNALNGNLRPCRVEQLIDHNVFKGRSCWADTGVEAFVEWSGFEEGLKRSRHVDIRGTPMWDCPIPSECSILALKGHQTHHQRALRVS